MNRKYFTPEQANNSLVLVEPIVKDIVSKRRKMIIFKRAIKKGQQAEQTPDIEKAVNGLVSSLKECSVEITHHLEELEMIGCYLKDFELGVVDFPSILKGRVVYLTWQLGEKKVCNWHEIVHNFDKKQPIDDNFVTLKYA